jgi:hypothetical protein
MKERSVKKAKRNMRRSKKGNAGLVLVFLIILIIFAAVIMINRYTDNPKENSAVIETANTNSTNLPQLAEQYYGNAAYWVYIYENNRHTLSSPVNIPEGLLLTVPDLRAQGINIKDSIEINKAKILANKLLSDRNQLRKNIN